MRCGKNRLVVGLLVISLSVAIVSPVTAQSADPVITAVEVVAQRVGRLLPAAIDPDWYTTAQGISVAVGTISHDGATPKIASILQRITEEELLLAGGSLSGRLGRPIEVTDLTTESDLTIRITSTTGVERVLFSIQIVDNAGRIRAAGRLDLPAGEALLEGLSPSPQQAGAAGTSGGDDTPNDPMQALPIEIGATLSGRSLEAQGDADWYTFTIDESVLSAVEGTEDAIAGIQVYTTGNTDTYIELYGPNSVTTLAAENDDSGSANASVTIVVETIGDQYWVKVRGFSDTSTGTYDLVTAVNALILDGAEPNDTQFQATALAREDLPFAASIRPAGDTDWFFLSPQLLSQLVSAGNEDGGTQRVATVSTMSELDTLIHVYDISGMELVYNDDGGEEGNARVVLTPDMGFGDGLYVTVTGYGDWTEGDYTLNVESETIDLDAFEPDNRADQASLIEIDGSPQRHTFSSESDEDWIRLEFSTRQRVGIETYGDVDTYMVLYDDRDTELASSDDDGYGLNARIEREFEAGTYYVQITPLYLETVGVEYSIDARSR